VSIAAGKVALVTGAARGPGRDYALRLAGEGADIIAVDVCQPIRSAGDQLGSPDDLNETAARVRALGRRALARPADTRDLGQLSGVIDEAMAEFGRLDIIVAAGRISGSASARELTESAWQDVIDVNLTGAWLTCKAAMPQLIAGGRGGSVVLVASAAGQRPGPDQAHEVAAAHAVAGLAKTLAQELAEQHIRVNVLSVSDGGVSDSGVASSAAGGDAGGDMLAFLVSDAAGHLTGIVLPAGQGSLV
jgi:(+)-trans-carveol dehydrogenase